MFCIKCGSKSVDQEKFCIKCGTALPVRTPEQPVPPSHPSELTPVTSGSATKAGPTAAPPAVPTSRIAPMTIAVVGLIALLVAGYFVFGPSHGRSEPLADRAPSQLLPTTQPVEIRAPDHPATRPAATTVVVTPESLIEAATVGDRAHLEGMIQRLEAQPKVATGDRNESRRLNNEALPLIHAGRFEEAIPLLQEANTADESNVEVTGNLADTYLRAGRMDHAWTTALAALRIAPRRTVGWSTLGMLLAIRDEPGQSTACFVTAYRFSRAQSTTVKVYERMAATDPDVRIREAVEAALDRIEESP